MLKVTDFGSSALLTKEDTDPETRVTVTETERCRTRQLRQDVTSYRYAAPEMIKRESYNFVADVWSTGVILWEMIQQNPNHPAVEISDEDNTMEKRHARVLQFLERVAIEGRRQYSQEPVLLLAFSSFS